MPLFLARIKWLFTAPLPSFFGGCMLTLGVVFVVYREWGEQWFLASALLLQLAGIVLTLRQLIELREQLGVDGLTSLFRGELRGFPRHQVVETSLHVNNSSVMQSTIDASVIPGKGGSPEEQLDRLWEFCYQLRDEMDTIEQKVGKDHTATKQAIETLGAKLDGQIVGVKRQVTEAVVSSPFAVLFGLWLVALSTGMQLLTILTATQQ